MWRSDRDLSLRHNYICLSASYMPTALYFATQSDIRLSASCGINCKRENTVLPYETIILA